MPNETDTKQILNTSDEAAKFVTDIKGWVDRHGRFFGTDERGARWSGCTHIVCSGCGVSTPKSYLKCSDCREKDAVERYKARERKSFSWLGVPVYSDAADEYFFNEDDLRDYIETNDVTAESLRLIICKPIYLKQIDEDYFCDELAEDGELPSKVIEALDNLNDIISTIRPVSWFPGKYAVSNPEEIIKR